MVLRRKSDACLLRARLNPQLPVGCYRDPSVEVESGAGWLGLTRHDLSDGFEIVLATPAEMDEMSLLTEYCLHFAVDFGMPTGTVQLQQV
ncbi:MAG TPA: hypothetical protein VG013_04945 [Gemmataceae bacterium]|jgi:hypothetical protein|nr:hypothetical protein [Gemmataceae bacterium]